MLVSGNREPPSQRVRELWLVVGRGAVATFVASVLAAHAAITFSRPDLGWAACRVSPEVWQVTDCFWSIWLVPVERIELPTFGLQNRCSTAELNRRIEAIGEG